MDEQTKETLEFLRGEASALEAHDSHIARSAAHMFRACAELIEATGIEEGGRVSARIGELGRVPA